MEPDLLSGPTDTAMMRIAHAAVRRDYARARGVLSQPPYPDDAQRAALCGHLNWMAAFLHRHHEGEDDTLYPMVTAANPAAAALVGAMAADHGAVQSALEAVESAAARYARSADGRAGLVAAIDARGVFAYRTQGRLMGDSTEWYFELRADEGGTTIAQHYRVRRLPLWADRLVWWAAPAHHDRTAALASDLERLAATAEREAAVPASAVPSPRVIAERT